MVTSMSIRELTRSGKELSKYDYVDIEDKKSNTYKGVFVPLAHAAKIKEYLNGLLDQEKAYKKQKILEFAGIMNGETENKKISELKAQKQ